MTLSPVKPGDVISAQDWNALLALLAGGVHAGAGLNATVTGSGIAITLDERRDRTIVWAVITGVHGQDGDAAETITYDAVQAGEPLAVLTAAVPAYGRVYASGVATRPARVGDLCLFVREVDPEGIVDTTLWILSEQYHGRRCSEPAPPPPPTAKGDGPLSEPAGEPFPAVQPTGFLARVFDAVAHAVGYRTADPAPPILPIDPEPAATPRPRENHPVPQPPQTPRPLAATHLIDLSIVGARVRVPIPPGVGVRVTASTSGGSWSAGNKLKVRLDGPGGSVDFATAREIAGPGGSVAIGTDELRGVAFVVVEQSGTPDSAGTYAIVRAVADYDAAVSIQAPASATSTPTTPPASDAGVTPDP